MMKVKLKDLFKTRFGFDVQSPAEISELEIDDAVTTDELMSRFVDKANEAVESMVNISLSQTITFGGERIKATESDIDDLPEFEFSQNQPTQMKTTLELFDEVTTECAEILRAKYDEYGASFAIMRLPSMTDQLLVKARRIRSIQEKTITATGKSALSDWKGLVNYGLLWLFQAEYMKPPTREICKDGFAICISAVTKRCAELLKLKTADYGDAWRDMRIESITDQILMKIERMRNIETQTPETARKACVEIAKDIVNYAIFGVVKFKQAE